MSYSNCFFGIFLGLTAGCGKELAQTATRAPSTDAATDSPSDAAPTAPVECRTNPGALTLPVDSTFGDGGEPTSMLIGTGYAAGEGPGLFVTARDAFRVYLNGELVIASRAPRVPAFVPLSILPGDNVLTVVVAAKHGTPAALVELDELEKTYVSDLTWKVSTTPESGFNRPEFDDSAWAKATDFGPIGALPGCDPVGVFPADTRAHWLGPAPGTGSVAVLRTLIHVTPIGFGAGTTGGSAVTPVIASSWDELRTAAEDLETATVVVLAEGVHDFRLLGADVVDQPACPSTCPDDPNHPLYTVLVGAETCPAPLVTVTRNDRILHVGSNKSIVGLGRGAALRGVTIELGSSHNVIARNLAIYDVNPGIVEAGDAFGLTAPTQVWIDHCTTKWISDGFSDVRAGAQNITLSWMHYDGSSPESCGGQNPRASQITDATVTFHHSFFDHVTSHSPLVEHSLARVHVLCVYTRASGKRLARGPRPRRSPGCR